MSKKTLILAIETARREWSVSLLDGSKEMSTKIGSDFVSSSEMLLKTISELFAENEISLEDLSAIGVSRGPGSFTGIRVGLATARGLALGGNLKCFGVTLFEALARINQSNHSNEKILAALVGGSNQIYWQAFSNHETDFQTQNLEETFFGELSVFAANIEKRLREKSKLKILLDADLYRILKQNEIFENQLISIVASDNLSYLIGLKCREFLSAELNKSQVLESLKPLYLRDLRIGGK